jgi:hypothetical protein
MNTGWIKLKFKSDALPGRGEGVAGYVDAEVQHDQYGCPYLNGRSLKGLLQEECSNLLFNLKYSPPAVQAAQSLFGEAGSAYEGVSIMHVGQATLPPDLLEVIKIGIKRGDFTREQILSSMTTIRRMTAMDYERMAPRDKSLRTIRLIRRDLILTAPLSFSTTLNPGQTTLLSACTAALRRVGSGRNRGHGRLEEAVLLDMNSSPVTFKDLLPLVEVQS